MSELHIAAQLSSEADLISSIFAQCFAQDQRTLLCGGGGEPLYQPAANSSAYHRVVFRADYPASALHEVAHWTIAGERRRQLLDYGYWYEADGRNDSQQRKFEQVEAQPQALEWIFSVAANRPFTVSIDNLNAEPMDEFPFKLAVWQQTQNYLRQGLPPRAARFRQALAAYFQSQDRQFSQPYSLDKL
jgi:elongation factor P hydroxylase